MRVAQRIAHGGARMSRYVIWSFEHRQWWRADRQGYTEHLSEAGRYSAEEAGDIVTGAFLSEHVCVNEAMAQRNGAPTVNSLWHRCSLPDSIVEALNSGDGTYRP
jgi:hypothetical protein